MNINIECVKKACIELDFSFRALDRNGLFIEVDLKNNHKTHFLHNIVPLSNQTDARIASDKEYTYHLLKNVLNIPVTRAFLDPNVIDEYKEYMYQKNIQQIIEDIKEHFTFPLIIKRNRGSTGNNVFACNNATEIESLLKIIFNKQSIHYDYVALAQEKINIKEEYRVIILNGKVKFAYIKDNSNAQFTGNLSPLHWKGAKAILLEDFDFRLKQLQTFVDILYKSFAIPFAGLDIALDFHNRLWLIEINSQPSFGHFIADNGEKKVIDLFKNIITLLNEEKSHIF